nr:SH3 domain-containing protein [Oscillochloris trichoides]
MRKEEGGAPMSEGSERPQRNGTSRQAADEGGRGGARRTERLSAGNEEWNQREPVNPGWRSERVAGARTAQAARRGKAGLPRSPQEFQIWLQAGGWRYLAAIAGLLVVLLIALLAFGRNDQRTAGLGIEDQRAPTSIVGAMNDPIVQATLTPAPTVPTGPRIFVVTGTGDWGLFLRPDHNANNTPIISYPDGTRLEQVGEDFVGPDRIWRQVRAPDGNTGWVAAEFLTPVP